MDTIVVEVVICAVVLQYLPVRFVTDCTGLCPQHHGFCRTLRKIVPILFLDVAVLVELADSLGTDQLGASAFGALLPGT